MNNTQNPKSFFSKYKIALIVSVIILALAATAWVKKDIIYLHYAVAKNNEFKPGDTLYASEYLFNRNKTINDIIIYQSVSPKSFFPFSNKSYMADVGLKIPGEKLLQRKTGKVGTYVGYKVGNLKIGDDHYIPFVYYIIKLDNSVLYKEHVISLPEAYNIQNGYIKDDNYLYVDSFNITDKDSKKFTKN
ncbi:hypothetical protein [Mucilaginibacter terrae]|uniref:GDYXXLXY domain-containing protein n=1 Tax=Mucilaginibacter terrae TaxID=1955052 RepID=A0ABU3H2H0_9SPHI|nr:hypothetical protein [Mucilaginibacter terrae]MDT3405110.1 hypothetical protein [Mucilaginibacter terrae]